MTATPDLWREPFIDNTSPGKQFNGVVAPTAGNQFFAAWVDATAIFRPAGYGAIIARSFDSLGNPLTGEVNLTKFDPSRDPAVVRLPIANQADGLALALDNFFSLVDAPHVVFNRT